MDASSTVKSNTTIPLAARLSFFPCIFFKGNSAVKQLWGNTHRVSYIVDPHDAY